MPVRRETATSGIVVLTLDAPSRRNALDVAMGDDLSGHCDDLADDPNLRAVVITGTPPAFSAGGDLSMLRTQAQQARAGNDTAPFMRAFYDRFLAVRALPVPVIAAVNGSAIGAGLCLALAADLRVLATDARVGLNFVRLGLHPGMGATWFLPRLVGPEVAARWLATGRIATGQEAVHDGLAITAVPADEVLGAATALAGEVAAAAPVAVRSLLTTLRGDQAALDVALDREARAQHDCLATDDLAAALEALPGGAVPTFEGR